MSGALSDPSALERITAYGYLIEANRRLERVFERSLRAHHGMSGVTLEALLRLGRSDEGRMSMSELAEQMVLSSGGVTRLVDRLSESGLVERRQCPDDRRVQWALITPLGRQALEDALATHLADLEHHFASHIDADEWPVVMRVLDRLRRECGAAADHSTSRS